MQKENIAMLKESINIRQIDGEPKRRWFSSDYFDLIVWFDNDHITGFQLCYEMQRPQKALTWKEISGYSHDNIDDGESRTGKYKATPILVANGLFDKNRIARTIQEESSKIDGEIADFVYNKILDYA